jgi:hypothetical protein
VNGLIYQKYIFSDKYPFIKPECSEENKLKSIISDLYGFIEDEIKIVTFYKNKSQKPFYLNNVNHYLLFKVKELYFLSVDGELELLDRER